MGWERRDNLTHGVGVWGTSESVGDLFPFGVTWSQALMPTPAPCFGQWYPLRNPFPYQPQVPELGRTQQGYSPP